MPAFPVKMTLFTGKTKVIVDAGLSCKLWKYFRFQGGVFLMLSDGCTTEKIWNVILQWIQSSVSLDGLLTSGLNNW